MIADYVESERTEITTYEIMFDDGHFNGYGFHCDKDGNLLEMPDAAKKNYQWCLEHSEEFVRANEIVSTTHTYTEPAKGKCSCGEVISLTNDYMGACECPKCGQWYNLWGQELLPPNRWNDEY